MEEKGNRWSRASWPKRLGWIAIGLFGLFLLIQLVPYGRDHANPPVTKSPAFVGAQTEQLFNTACGDCHSNLTTWPWYSNVAPVSWLVQSDVDEGRGVMNFSEWDKPQPSIDEVV
jgi:mono/diheme cytochrome c family protein